jgi:hypothetical protein
MVYAWTKLRITLPVSRQALFLSKLKIVLTIIMQAETLFMNLAHYKINFFKALAYVLRKEFYVTIEKEPLI